MKSRHRRWPVAAAMLLYFTTRVQAAITISPTALPPWTVNIVYSQTLTASGCLILVGCSWSVTAGALPTGLSLDASSAVISGTPTAIGRFEFTVTASTLLESGSQAYTVVINPPPGITTASLASGRVNEPYSQSVGVAGGTSPYNFSVSAGRFLRA